KRPVRGAAAARLSGACAEPRGCTIVAPGQAGLPHRARGPARTPRPARDGRAWRARDVLSQALRRRPDDCRPAPRARRAIRARPRGAARSIRRDREDELESWARLVSPPLAPPRARAHGAGARVGAGRRAGAPPRAAMIAWTG